MDTPLMSPKHTLSDYIGGSDTESAESHAESDSTADDEDKSDEQSQSEGGKNTLRSGIHITDTDPLVSETNLPTSTLAKCDLSEPQVIDGDAFPCDVPEEIGQLTRDYCTENCIGYTAGYPVFHIHRGLGWEYYRLKITNEHTSDGWYIRVEQTTCHSNPQQAFNATTAQTKRLTQKRWFSVDNGDHCKSSPVGPSESVTAQEAIEHTRSIGGNNKPYAPYFGIQQHKGWTPVILEGDSMVWERYPSEWNTDYDAISDLLKLYRHPDRSNSDTGFVWDVKCHQRLSCETENPPKSPSLYLPKRTELLNPQVHIAGIDKEPTAYPIDQLADIVIVYLNMQ